MIIGVDIDANEFQAKFVIADSVLDTCKHGYAGRMVALIDLPSVCMTTIKILHSLHTKCDISYNLHRHCTN